MWTAAVEVLVEKSVVAVVGLAAVALLVTDLLHGELHRRAARRVTSPAHGYGIALAVVFVGLAGLRFVWVGS